MQANFDKPSDKKKLILRRAGRASRLPCRRMAENGFAPPLGNFADISDHVEN